MSHDDNTTHVYYCINKRCSGYQVEFTSSSPYQSRKLYGRPIMCARCGGHVQFLRFAAAPTTGRKSDE